MKITVSNWHSEKSGRYDTDTVLTINGYSYNESRCAMNWEQRDYESSCGKYKCTVRVAIAATAPDGSNLWSHGYRAVAPGWGFGSPLTHESKKKYPSQVAAEEAAIEDTTSFMLRSHGSEHNAHSFAAALKAAYSQTNQPKLFD